MNELQDNSVRNILLFNLDELHYALYLSAVTRVIRSVEITALPNAPKIIMGIINVHGTILPVIDIRSRFKIQSRTLTVDDQFIIAQTSKRSVVLAVDSVDGVHEVSAEQIVTSEDALPFTTSVSGVAKIDADIVLITDLEQFLSLEEERLLDDALHGGAV